MQQKILKIFITPGKLYNEYAKNISKARYKTKHGAGLKILTPKQML